ncbi:hypothetical protein H9P43_005153 [Blastocladiella emersonii ATCC 22665]|nr:hypothetical protein H9P43_005153 [Blastocladiella emersonii ATCC 22665]
MDSTFRECAAHGPPGYTALSLTHVLVPSGSGLAYLASYLLAYATLLPLAMVVSYATLCVSRWRQSVWRIMFAGQLANEGINFVLKRWIREHRPSPCHGKGYGMPSSHAQFMAYFVAFSLLLIRLERNRVQATHPLLQPALQAAIAGAAVLVIYSRVHLEYHTVAQVLAGTAIGLVTGTLWFVAACPELPFGPRRRPGEAGAVASGKPEDKQA